MQRLFDNFMQSIHEYSIDGPKAMTRHRSIYSCGQLRKVAPEMESVLKSVIKIVISSKERRYRLEKIVKTWVPYT